MNINKTKEYYKNLNTADLCQCDYCKNYVTQINQEYPLLKTFLNDLGVDISKPFETNPLEVNSTHQIEYASVQYIILGEKNDFTKTTVSNVTIDIAKSHPSTDIQDVHFVIEVYPIILNWVI